MTFQNTFSDLVIQIVAISESVRLQQVLATYGIQTQTPKQVEPLLIWPPAELLTAYANLGSNAKLGCSGRPKRPIGVLGTCKVKVRLDRRFDGRVFHLAGLSRLFANGSLLSVDLRNDGFLRLERHDVAVGQYSREFRRYFPRANKRSFGVRRAIWNSSRNVGVCEVDRST